LVRLTPRDSLVEARFGLDDRVPYLVDEDERAITVRLYGARSDLDFVQYGGTDSLVRRVSWAQPSDDECTVTFELATRVFGWRTRWDGADLMLDIRRPPDIADFIGKNIECKILKIDEARRNIVVSRRKLIEEERERAKDGEAFGPRVVEEDHAGNKHRDAKRDRADHRRLWRTQPH
jgi:hypothetical protein